MDSYTTALLTEAINFYDFANPKAEFIRHNENMTYSIEDGQMKYLLRIHEEAEGLDFSFSRGELSRELLISSEIELLNGLFNRNDLVVQKPVKNKGNQYLTRLKNGTIATVLSWINGDTLYRKELSVPAVYKIGQMIAMLHRSTRVLPRMNRLVYDETIADMLLSETQVAKNIKHIDVCICEKFLTLINETKKVLLRQKEDFIIIHADLSKSNMVDNGITISPIDFSMSGYGSPELEIGGLYFDIDDNKSRLALLSGYESVAGSILNKEYINMYEAYSVIWYILIHHKQWGTDEKFQRKIERLTANTLDPLL